MAVRRRVWCETMPWGELTGTKVLAGLRARKIEPIIAVRPPDRQELPELARTMRQAGVHAAFWPMLDDESGRWAGAANVQLFSEFAEEVAALAEATEIVVDLEPPIDRARGFAHGAVGAAFTLAVTRASGRELRAARASLERLVDHLDKRGVKTSACVLPPVILDRGRVWQSLLGTPAFGPKWHEVHVMLYSSIIEGWSKGLLKRNDARAVVSRFARAVRAELGTRGAVALGLVGHGAFGDEPVYRNRDELIDDVGLVLAAGVEHLSLFDLGGAYLRGDPDDWLDAFEIPVRASGHPRSWRAHALFGAARLLGGK